MILIIGRRSRKAIPALVALCLIAGCSPAQPLESEGPLVVATTSILGEIATRIVGDHGTVEVVIPVGVDAHEFQPSSQQAALMAGADLVVANGLGLEQGLQDVLEATRAEGTPVVELAPLVDPLPLETGAGDDPHFWMDPTRVAAAGTALAARMADVSPDVDWAATAAEYAAEMAATDAEVEALLAPIASEARRLVTNHEALGYFADRYGFTIVGVIVPGGSSLGQPSSAELADLVTLMEQEGTNVIFAETTQPSDLAEALAAELGGDVEVIELYTESLGADGSGAETISGMLTTNARLIAGALG